MSRAKSEIESPRTPTLSIISVDVPGLALRDTYLLNELLFSLQLVCVVVFTVVS